MRWFTAFGSCLATIGCTGPSDGSFDTGRSEPHTDTDRTDTDDTDPVVDTGTAPYEMSGFSFVDPHLAGMPQPGRYVELETDLAFLAEQQIALLVSLTVTPTDPVAVEAAGLGLLHLPIPDFTPPTLQQQIDFVAAMDARVALGQKVGVHDTAGLGRCGTMLATWFVAKGMEPEEAIVRIRELRPGSIETDAQELAIYAYASVY